jgi:hypothetical protein
MPKESGLMKPLLWAKIAPATPAIAEPSTNIVMRERSTGTPRVAATTSWSRMAMVSRWTGDRARKIVRVSTRANAPNHTQKILYGLSSAYPNTEMSRMPVVVSPLAPVNSVQRWSTSSTISLRPRVAIAK